MGTQLLHFEIAGRDGERLERFYSQLFGWRIERKEAGGFPYGEIPSPRSGAPTGGIRHEPEGRPEIVLYFGVSDIDDVLVRAEKLGAEIRIPAMKTSQFIFALITDPEGNPIGLLEKP